jgi:hypothetical protein
VGRNDLPGHFSIKTTGQSLHIKQEEMINILTRWTTSGGKAL